MERVEHLQDQHFGISLSVQGSQAIFSPIDSEQAQYQVLGAIDERLLHTGDIVRCERPSLTMYFASSAGDNFADTLAAHAPTRWVSAEALTGKNNVYSWLQANKMLGDNEFFVGRRGNTDVLIKWRYVSEKTSEDDLQRKVALIAAKKVLYLIGYEGRDVSSGDVESILQELNQNFGECLLVYDYSEFHGSEDPVVSFLNSWKRPDPVSRQVYFAFPFSAEAVRPKSFVLSGSVMTYLQEAAMAGAEARLRIGSRRLNDGYLRGREISLSERTSTEKGETSLMESFISLYKSAFGVADVTSVQSQSFTSAELQGLWLDPKVRIFLSFDDQGNPISFFVGTLHIGDRDILNRYHTLNPSFSVPMNTELLSEKTIKASEARRFLYTISTGTRPDYQEHLGPFLVQSLYYILCCTEATHFGGDGAFAWGNNLWLKLARYFDVRQTFDIQTFAVLKL